MGPAISDYGSWGNIRIVDNNNSPSPPCPLRSVDPTPPIDIQRAPLFCRRSMKDLQQEGHQLHPLTPPPHFLCRHAVHDSSCTWSAVTVHVILQPLAVATLLSLTPPQRFGYRYRVRGWGRTLKVAAVHMGRLVCNFPKLARLASVTSSRCLRRLAIPPQRSQIVRPVYTRMTGRINDNAVVDHVNYIPPRCPFPRS